jgi:maltooligosyltrehalose trehalohydrolase
MDVHAGGQSSTFGPAVLPNGRVNFRIWAPSAATMRLRIGDEEPRVMRQESGGWFEFETAAKPGTPYQFVLQDGTHVPDPASRAQQDDVHGASLVVDPGAYAWRNTAWRNRPWHEAVIYELHPGALGGFRGVIGHLERLAALGITAIELMPIADFPGCHNWGYDGVLPYAPDAAYGTPEDLKALVDAAHGAGLMIFLDVVYNHFGPDGAYLYAYAPEFFDEGVHTPWGAAIDFKRSEVAAYFTENALMWLNEYRFDGLRFDAVHAISPESYLPALAAAIRAGADRPAHLILEHEGNKSSLLRGPAARLFDAQWADDWHHCLHVLLTGEHEGYYESFADPATQLARAMAEGFVFQGEISPHHNAPRGEPSADLPPTAFVICLQNHDQIGNRAMGERLAALADPDALAAAASLLLLSPAIPMLFMGEEWGSRTPFLFFTDHNEELAKLVREGRRREFAHFAAFQDEATRARIPDPNAPSTFAASVPDIAEAEQERQAATLELHRRLLALRRDHVVPGIPGCCSLGAAALGPAAVRGSWRLGNGATLTLAANFGTEPVAFDVPPGQAIFASAPLDAADALPPRCTLAFLAPAS